MRCRNCGNELSDDARFCDRCGASVHAPQGRHTKKKKHNGAAVAAIIVLAIIAAAAAVVFGYTSYINNSETEKNKAAATIQPTHPAAAVHTMPPSPTHRPVSSAAPASANGSNTQPKTYYVANCNEYISLRARPSTEAEALRTMPLGASVSYLGDADNGFAKVEYRGTTGYALKSYLSRTAPSGGNSASGSSGNDFDEERDNSGYSGTEYGEDDYDVSETESVGDESGYDSEDGYDSEEDYNSEENYDSEDSYDSSEDF